jgi:hypothetical protein
MHIYIYIYIYIYFFFFFFFNLLEGLEVELHVFSTYKALGPIPSTKRKRKINLLELGLFELIKTHVQAGFALGAI